MEIVASGLPAVPLITPCAEVGGAAPFGCAFALPEKKELPNAVAIAAFAVERNN
jgi:hypothetical protein